MCLHFKAKFSQLWSVISNLGVYYSFIYLGYLSFSKHIFYMLGIREEKR